jgi:hypothetical protein
MGSDRAVGYLLKAERRYVSFHATLPDAQEAAEDYPEQTDLLVHTTSGALVAWCYDWETRTWERGRVKESCKGEQER